MADREFIGEKWFGWLIAEKIPFYVRIRNDANTHNKNNKSIDVSWLFYYLRAGEKSSIDGKKKIFGQEVFLIVNHFPAAETHL